MQADGTEDEWQTLTELQQTRADAIWASEKITREAQCVLSYLNNKHRRVFANLFDTISVAVTYILVDFLLA